MPARRPVPGLTLGPPPDAYASAIGTLASIAPIRAPTVTRWRTRAIWTPPLNSAEQRSGAATLSTPPEFRPREFQGGSAARTGQPGRKDQAGVRPAASRPASAPYARGRPRAPPPSSDAPRPRGPDPAGLPEPGAGTAATSR